MLKLRAFNSVTKRWRFIDGYDKIQIPKYKRIKISGEELDSLLLGENAIDVLPDPGDKYVNALLMISGQLSVPTTGLSGVNLSFEPRVVWEREASNDYPHLNMSISVLDEPHFGFLYQVGYSSQSPFGSFDNAMGSMCVYLGQRGVGQEEFGWGVGQELTLDIWYILIPKA